MMKRLAEIAKIIALKLVMKVVLPGLVLLGDHIAKEFFGTTIYQEV